MSDVKFDLKDAVWNGFVAAAMVLIAGLFAMFIFHFLNQEVSEAIPAVGYVGSVWTVIAASFFGTIWNSAFND